LKAEELTVWYKVFRICIWLCSSFIKIHNFHE